MSRRPDHPQSPELTARTPPRAAGRPAIDDDTIRIVFRGFPADVLFHFRFYAIGAQLVLWATIGLVFAPMAERLLAGAPARPAPALVNG